MRQNPADEVGAGPLSRVAAGVYRAVTLQIALVLTCAPTVVLLALLARDPSNVPLFALALAPVAPALSAGLYALRAWEREGGLSPGRAFWRGYRLNAVDVLRWWVPALVAAVVLGVTVANADVVPTAAVFRPVAVVMLLLLALVCGHLLVITSYFGFRTRDAWRIATTEIARSWRTTLGMASLLVVTAGIVWLRGEPVLLLLGWALVMLLRIVAAPLVQRVQDTYVAP